MNYLKAIPLRPGFAELVFSNPNTTQSLFFISIQRRGHSESHLGNNGWQVSEHTFQLQARIDNEQLKIEVGPAVVAYMDDKSNYEFLIGETEADKSLHIVRWSGVPGYIRPKGNESLIDLQPRPITPTPPPVTPPLPVSPPIGVQQAPIATPLPISPILPVSPVPLTISPIPLVPTPVPQPPKIPPVSGGGGVVKINCGNCGKPVLSTFKICPSCHKSTEFSQPVSGNVSSKTTPIQPVTIVPSSLNSSAIVSSNPTNPTNPTIATSTASGLSAAKVFCGNCGKPVLSTMIKCPSCGEPTGKNPSVGGVSSPTKSHQGSGSTGSVSTANITNLSFSNMQLASRWARLGAVIIDNIIIANILMWLLLKLVFGNEMTDLFSDNPMDVEADGLAILKASLIQFVMMILYHSIFNASDESGTFGKMICGIRVRDMQGQRISFGKSLGRTLLTLIPPMSLGVLFIFFNDKRQTMSDQICDTLVIKKG